jgi:Ca-activated chloride channel family protein
MKPALQMALGGDVSPGRLHQVVFLTDGAVGNEAELFEDIHARLGDTRLFTIGIGSAPNSWFMRKAAEVGRGSFTYIGDIAEVAERTGELLRKLGEPVLTDIALGWPAAAGDTVQVLPAPVPDLYRGEPVTFTARLPGVTQAALGGTLSLDGRLAGGTWHEAVDLSATRPASGIASLWARDKLGDIEDGLWRGGDADSIHKEATALALNYGLVSTYTSLVAVDRTIVRPDTAPLHHQPVATNLPQGWEYDKVFGGTTTGAPPVQQDSIENFAPAPEPTLAPAPRMREVQAPAGTQLAMTLPRTATPAPLHLVIGVVLLAMGLVWLLAVRRRARVPAA